MNRIKLLCTAALSTVLLTVLAVFAAPASASIVTFFGTVVPSTTASDDTAGVSVGTKFTTSTSGRITGIRFYKGVGNTGTHVVALYSSAGVELARATATNETAIGWQNVGFGGVTVAAGTYTAAVFHPQGHYSVQAPSSWPKTSGSLKATSGVYRYGSSIGYPTSTWNAANYFVDVNFSASAGSPSSPSPTKSTTSPSPTAPPTVANPTPTRTSTPSTTGFPDASSTGVPAGTTLTKVPAGATSGPGWSWRSGDGCVHVDTAGAVVSGLDVAGCIEVYANNVTIQSSRVTAPGDGWAIGLRGASGVTIKDSTLSGGGKRMAVGVKDVTGSSDATVLRVNVSGYSSGLQLSRGLVQDSYVHDPIMQAGDHTNGFTDNGGRTDGSMVLRHNTILNNFDQADAISFFQDFGVIKNVTADDNLIAGGSYTLYGGAGGKGASSNVAITNNRFSTRFFPNSATYGPVCCFDHAGNTWSGNVWADGPKAGQTITAP